MSVVETATPEEGRPCVNTFLIIFKDEALGKRVCVCVCVIRIVLGCTVSVGRAI